MARLRAVDRRDHPELEPVFQRFEAYLGFVPNSALTMAHRPALLEAFVNLTTTVNAPGSVDTGLKALVGLMASVAAGCQYCQAHLADKAVFQDLGVEAQLDAIWDFESSPLFSDRERAALRLARDAAQTPNAVTAAHFDELARHFDEGDLVELMAVIAIFGFLNRWNDSIATDLEESPLKTASAHLAAGGWQPGKHEGTSAQ